MQLRPVVVARPPAGLAVKPLKPIAHAAKATVLNTASYGLRPLLPRISHSLAPLPAPCSARGRTGRCSCPAPRTKARDEAETERELQQESAAAERKEPAPAGERSMAYEIIAGLYVCAYIFLWRTAALTVGNAELALLRFRRYVRENFFNQKR